MSAINNELNVFKMNFWELNVVDYQVNLGPHLMVHGQLYEEVDIIAPLLACKVDEWLDWSNVGPRESHMRGLTLLFALERVSLFLILSV